MAYTTTEINSYSYMFFSSSDNAAKVSFYDSSGANFATAFIRPDSETLPAAYQDSGGMYRLYYKISRLPHLIDMLRNEKPVYLRFWTGTGNNTHIGTGQEPVGEMEP